MTAQGGASTSSSSSNKKQAGGTLKTTYGLRNSFEPLYTGGASTAITSDGIFLFAPVNDVIQCTNTHTGRVVARIPSDLEDVTNVCLSPDQSTLIVASRSLALRVIALTFSRSDDASRSSSSSNVPVTEETVSLHWSLQRTIAKSHDAPVVVMRVDPTSTLLATGSSDTTAKVWDLRGGFCTHVFRGHGGIVSSLAWNMAERRIELFSGSIDGRIRRWDLKSANGGHAGKPAEVLEAHFSVVRGLDVSKDGTRLVSAGRDRMVGLWEAGTSRGVRSWRLAETLTASEALESAGFLADDGDVFWTAGTEGELRIWSFVRRGVVKVQPNGRFARGLVTQKQSSDGKEEDEDEDEDANETRAVTEVHWLAQFDTLVTVHADQEFIFHSSKTLGRKRQLAGFTDQIIDGVLLSASEEERDSHLAVATNSTYIRVYDLCAREQSVDVLPNEQEEGHSGLILCLDKTTDGRWLASGGKDRDVRIWAYVPKVGTGSGGDLVDAMEEEIGVPVNGVQVFEEKSVRRGWSCVAIAKGHTESVGALAFARRATSPTDMGAPFLVTGSQDRTAKVWDLTGLPKYIEKHFSQQGSRTPMVLHSLTTLKIHEKDINALDISPNNALLLSGSQDKTAKVFSVHFQAPSKANAQRASATLSPITTCKGHKRGVWSVAFSPVDAVFMTASSDRTMKLWSINDGFTCVKNYVGHTNSVLRVRFLRGSTKGLQCVSCGSDGLVKMWNVRSEECVETLDGHEERVWALDTTIDGETVVSGGADGMIRFWQNQTEQRASEQLEERQRMVEQEQTFGNLLAVKDYRNAISLALAMRQPRRLFDLFTAVDHQRQYGERQATGDDAVASLLHDAMHGRGEAKSAQTTLSLRDPALAQVLTRAGVLPSSTNITTSSSRSTPSITGSLAVDEVIEHLKPSQLATLLTFVRDWNTSVRSANVAQTVLHAILRFHSADVIIEAFEAPTSSRAHDNSSNGGDGGGGNEKGNKERTKKANLTNVLEALLPYTRRHYDRAQRILTESAMLDYTLANMDAILGVEEEEKEGEKDNEGIANGGVALTTSESDSSDDEEMSE